MPLSAVRPEPSEYAPFYEKYIALVEGPVLEALEAQARATGAFLATLSEEQGNLRYAPEKWSIKQVIGHLADTERMFGYRALRFARRDATPIEGFNQDEYAQGGGHDARTLKSVAAELAAVRAATLALFGGFEEEAWLRRGVANKYEVSVRAIACIAAGHELHHVDIIKKKYL